MKSVDFKILRFNPELDSKPYFQAFDSLSYRENDTVIKLLLKIKHTIDPSLTFRYSCQCTICGSCAMFISGKSRLACETKIDDVNQNGVVEIQPLRHFTTIKDLVADIEPMITSLIKVAPWLIRDHKNIPEKEYRIQPSLLTSSLQMLDRCILCGICHSDGFREDESIISPAALVKAFKLIQDPRDIAKFRIKQLIELGIMAHPNEWNVTCPKGIDLDNDVLLPLKNLTQI